MQRRPESVERSPSRSAAQVGGQSIPALSGTGSGDLLATLIMLAGLYGCDSYGARHVA